MPVTLCVKPVHLPPFSLRRLRWLPDLVIQPLVYAPRTRISWTTFFLQLVSPIRHSFLFFAHKINLRASGSLSLNGYRVHANFSFFFAEKGAVLTPSCHLQVAQS